MELEIIGYDLSICKVDKTDNLDLSKDFFFLSKTDEEISLVCKTEDIPKDAMDHSDGWKAFRISGVLDFSLIGILSKITGILADNQIGIFAVSTYNTDYILVKKEQFDKAIKALMDNVVWLSRLQFPYAERVLRGLLDIVCRSEV